MKIEALGRKATIYTADMASDTDVSALTKKIIDDGHDINILVNCAGITTRHPAHEYPKKDWDQVRVANFLNFTH